MEKFFPEDTQQERFVLGNEIKVPKNFMLLTDKLPAPMYHNIQVKALNKNKSESQFSLPKLNSN